VGASAACANPVPVSAAVCGAFEAVSFTVSVPVSAPIALGVNVMVSTQLPFAATLPLQLSLSAKSAFPVVIIPSVSATVSRLLKVSVLGELAVLCATLPKPRLGADKTTGKIEVPFKVTVCGLVEALSVTVSVPLSVPSTLGVSVTVIVQVPLAGTVPTQLSVSA